MGFVVESITPSSGFTWDVNRSIPQVLDDETFRYAYGVGRIAQVESDGTTHYYLPDGLGSTMALTDASGDVVNTYEHDVFGALRSSTGSQPNDFLFTGEQFEAWEFEVPTSEPLPLDEVVSSTNLSGATVANLEDDPDQPDANWATAASVDDTELRVDFPTPAEALQQGAGMQEFRVLLRKDAAGGNDPTYDMELWETGGSSPLATLASGMTLSSDAGEVVSVTWDASLLAAADGSAVEVRIFGDRSNGNPSVRRTVEVGAVEWVAATTRTEQAGLYYLRARYYDPETGRFMSRDPLGSSPAWDDHPFAYVQGNPANVIDPLGLCGLLDLFGCVEEVVEVVTDAGDGAFDAGRLALNAVPSTIAYVYGEATGNCDYAGDLVWACSEVPLAGAGVAIGNVALTSDKGFGPDLLRHEKRHSTQEAILGLLFPTLYTLDQGARVILPGDASCWNVFEWSADFDDGEYACDGFGQPRANHSVASFAQVLGPGKE